MTVDLVVIGAGNRGWLAYGRYALAHPARARFVAVAEPDDGRRAAFAREHGIPSERRFARWEDLLARDRLAEGALVCTQDQLHVEPTIAALERGYHVLLEKPMATTLEGCLALVRTADRCARTLQVCHVLRFTPFFRRLAELVTEDEIGEIVSVEHRENVSYWHMAHSFVRGNWRREALACPMILAKCCHDLDLIASNLKRPCIRLGSFGSLLAFRPERAPAGAPERCTDGCPVEPTCPYSAGGIYLDYRPFDRPYPFDPARPEAWPFNVLTQDLDHTGRLAALRVGPYGRCVYRCDNDVVDHQVVSMEFSGGATAVLVMHGHSAVEGRTMRYDGTRATVRGAFTLYGTSELTIQRHAGGLRRYEVEPVADQHGGGDAGVMESFVQAIDGGSARGALGAAATTVRAALESHLLAFAAERARISGEVVDLKPLRRLVDPEPAS